MTAFARASNIAVATRHLPVLKVNTAIPSRAGLTGFAARRSGRDQMEHLSGGMDEKMASKTIPKQPLDLTAGIEVEFVLVKFCDENTNPFSQNAEWARRLIHNALSVPLRARCATCNAEHHFFLPLNRLNSSDKNYRGWHIKTDGTVKLKREDRCALPADGRDSVMECGMELTSRILSLNKAYSTTPSDDGSHTHSVAWRDEIKAVLVHLDHAFNTPEGRFGERSNTGMFVNSTSGLHDHLGNNGEELPLQTLKNLLSIYVANERQVDSMHAVDRIGGSTLTTHVMNERLAGWGLLADTMDSNVYNQPLSSIFTLLAHRRSRKQHLPVQEWTGSTISKDVYPQKCFDDPGVKAAAFGLDKISWIHLIQAAPSLEDLRTLSGTCDHQLTVNLEHLPTPGMGIEAKLCKKTVEFRQHASSLQAAEVVAWVDVCAQMMTFAHDNSQDTILGLCAGEWSSQEHHILDLLTTIGCSDATTQFYFHRLGLTAEDDHWANDVCAYEQANAVPSGTLDPLQPLVLALADDKYRANCPKNVSSRINQKTVLGGYGQLSELVVEHLKEAGAPAAAADRLRIGSIAALQAEEDHWDPGSPFLSPGGDGSANFEGHGAVSTQPLLNSNNDGASFPYQIAGAPLAIEQAIANGDIIVSPVSGGSRYFCPASLRGVDILFRVSESAGDEAPLIGNYVGPPMPNDPSTEAVDLYSPASMDSAISLHHFGPTSPVSSDSSLVDWSAPYSSDEDASDDDSCDDGSTEEESSDKDPLEEALHDNHSRPIPHSDRAEPIEQQARGESMTRSTRCAQQRIGLGIYGVPVDGDTWHATLDSLPPYPVSAYGEHAYNVSEISGHAGQTKKHVGERWRLH